MRKETKIIILTIITVTFYLVFLYIFNLRPVWVGLP